MNELFERAGIVPDQDLLVEGNVDTFLELRAKVNLKLALDIGNYRAQVNDEPWKLAFLGNLIPDTPVVLWTRQRGFGLFADRFYKSTERVTHYDGLVGGNDQEGDYVVQVDKYVTMDGKYGFELRNKGRWINEGPKQNVNMRREKPLPFMYVDYGQDVNKGQEFFWAYGPYYKRNY